MTEKDFDNNKYDAKVYFGTTDDNECLKFESNKPIKVVLEWNDGIKIGKEVFSGFDEKHGVYTPIEGVDLSEQGRFMVIVEKKIKKDDIFQQTSYLDF